MTRRRSFTACGNLSGSGSLQPPVAAIQSLQFGSPMPTSLGGPDHDENAGGNENGDGNSTLTVDADAPTTGSIAVSADANASGSAKAAASRKRAKSYTEDKRFKIFSGSSNLPLAEEICKFVGVPLGEVRLQRFSDGEVYFQLLENVRGADVFVGAADLLSRRSAFAGAADHDRRVKAGFSTPHHRGGSVLRLCAARSQRPSARRDLFQAGSGFVDDCGC